MLTLRSVPAADPLYPELWRACAGPLVDVPRLGDLVFYFPQGHIEQVGIRAASPPPFRLDPPSRVPPGLDYCLLLLRARLRWRRP
jgi:hypothetical protein